MIDNASSAAPCQGRSPAPEFDNGLREDRAGELDLLREELREAKETLEAIRTRSRPTRSKLVSRNGKEIVYTHGRRRQIRQFRIFLEEMQEAR